MDRQFMEKIFRADRWKVRHEVLNVVNINFPPPDYDGNQEEWIQDDYLLCLFALYKKTLPLFNQT